MDLMRSHFSLGLPYLSLFPSPANGQARYSTSGYKLPVKWPCTRDNLGMGSLTSAGEWLCFEPHGPIDLSQHRRVTLQTGRRVQRRARRGCTQGGRWTQY